MDIRDAMLSLLKIVSNLETKLERHESREKTLGDQIKRTLSSLERGHKGLEPLKGAVSRLDERLAKVETILIQVKFFMYYFKINNKCTFSRIIF